MHVAEVIALGYHYPTPLAADELSAAIDENLHGRVEHDMRRFLEGVRPLSLGEWEELHTRTLDLAPQAAWMSVLLLQECVADRGRYGEARRNG